MPFSDSSTTLDIISPTAQHQAEAAWLEILSGLLPGQPMGAESHFFDDLGANSMTMAQFCARTRKQPDLPAVSIRDVYAAPSVAGLVRSLVDSPVAPVPTAVVTSTPTPAGSSVRHAVCGMVQAIAFAGYAYVLLSLTVAAYGWVAEAVGLVATYLRAVLAGGAVFLLTCLLPVLVKWVLVGRWRARSFPLWGWGYLRFWAVKMLLQANPMILFVGSPLYTAYLRTLGARIGPEAVVLSKSIPVCTDLLSIGAGAVVRKDAIFPGYHGAGGRIVTGPVTIGAGAYVGEKTVLDIDTEVGPGAQLGHTSSLQPGQRVPAGQRWHGAPAVPTQVEYDRAPELPGSRSRAAWFVVGSVLQTFLVSVPLASAGVLLLLDTVPQLARVMQPASVTSWAFLLEAAAIALGVVLLVGVGGLVLTFTLPRLLAKRVRPGVAYPLYGVHYSLHRSVTALTNRRLYTWLFGDSSYIVGYLRRLGYDLTDAAQTGSNFGTEVQHETPFHITVGPGTMVADGLSIINTDYSATSFVVSPVVLGSNSFLGNNIAYPAGGRTGENVLLATKVMVPLDGPVRTDVGLLGSPPFEIPRTVERDCRFDHLREGVELARRLRAKNRYNLRSMTIMSFARAVDVFLVASLGLLLLEDTDPASVAGQLAIAAYGPLALVLSATYFILLERGLCRFRPLRPRLCSIYEPYFWWHERLWKVPDRYLNLFNGTPFKSLVWRCLGVRVGRRVFDDGCYITERTLAALGDDAVLNVGSKIQCHSQEDGTFKSDRTAVAPGATLGVGAFVHYGVEVGSSSTITADAFVMKGTQVPDHEHWGGNPATPVRQAVASSSLSTTSGGQR